MRRRLFLGSLMMLCALAGTVPARAQGTVVYSGPGSYLTNYTTPVTAARVAGELTYVNTDIARHDVVARVKGPDEPWCAEAGFPQPGSCPLFWTPLIGIGTVEILGLENLVAGQSYEFYCTIHSNMDGTLVALP